MLGFRGTTGYAAFTIEETDKVGQRSRADRDAVSSPGNGGKGESRVLIPLSERILWSKPASILPPTGIVITKLNQPGN